MSDALTYAVKAQKALDKAFAENGPVESLRAIAVQMDRAIAMLRGQPIYVDGRLIEAREER